MMTDEEVEKLDKIKKCRKRATQADGYINMIYKMHRDGVWDDIIYSYVISRGYSGKPHALKDYIYLIKKNNFPDRMPMNLSAKTWSYPDDVTVIKRTELLNFPKNVFWHFEVRTHHLNYLI